MFNASNMKELSHSFLLMQSLNSPTQHIFVKTLPENVSGRYKRFLAVFSLINSHFGLRVLSKSLKKKTGVWAILFNLLSDVRNNKFRPIVICNCFPKAAVLAFDSLNYVDSQLAQSDSECLSKEVTRVYFARRG